MRWDVLSTDEYMIDAQYNSNEALKRAIVCRKGLGNMHAEWSMDVIWERNTVFS